MLIQGGSYQLVIFTIINAYVVVSACLCRMCARVCVGRLGYVIHMLMYIHMYVDGLIKLQRKPCQDSARNCGIISFLNPNVVPDKPISRLANSTGCMTFSVLSCINICIHMCICTYIQK